MDTKTIVTWLKKTGSARLPITVVGYRRSPHHPPFVVMRIGDSSGCEFNLHFKVDEALALSEAMRHAAEHADPREATAADLGLEAA